MIEEVIAQKIASLQRCIVRAREELSTAGASFNTNFSAQDAAVLNIIRACDTTIDLANMLIRKRKLGIPTESRESLQILTREKLLDRDLADRLKRMVGFRNLADHQYRELDLGIVESVIRNNLDDLAGFAESIRVTMARCV
jgi:uncharacterized protein YutE (UPF0331/DUF86 family)